MGEIVMIAVGIASCKIAIRAARMATNTGIRVRKMAQKRWKFGQFSREVSI